MLQKQEQKRQVDENEECILICQQILDVRSHKGTPQYYIQWKGVEESFRSWVNLEDLDDFKEQIERYHQKKQLEMEMRCLTKKIGNLFPSFQIDFSKNYNQNQDENNQNLGITNLPARLNFTASQLVTPKKAKTIKRCKLNQTEQWSSINKEKLTTAPKKKKRVQKRSRKKRVERKRKRQDSNSSERQNTPSEQIKFLEEDVSHFLDQLIQEERKLVQKNKKFRTLPKGYERMDLVIELDQIEYSQYLPEKYRFSQKKQGSLSIENNVQIESRNARSSEERSSYHQDLPEKNQKSLSVQQKYLVEDRQQFLVESKADQMEEQDQFKAPLDDNAIQSPFDQNGCYKPCKNMNLLLERVRKRSNSSSSQKQSKSVRERSLISLHYSDNLSEKQGFSEKEEQEERKQQIIKITEVISNIPSPKKNQNYSEFESENAFIKLKTNSQDEHKAIKTQISQLNDPPQRKEKIGYFEKIKEKFEDSRSKDDLDLSICAIQNSAINIQKINMDKVSLKQPQQHVPQSSNHLQDSQKKVGANFVEKFKLAFQNQLQPDITINQNKQGDEEEIQVVLQEPQNVISDINQENKEEKVDAAHPAIIGQCNIVSDVQSLSEEGGEQKKAPSKSSKKRKSQGHGIFQNGSQDQIQEIPEDDYMKSCIMNSQIFNNKSRQISKKYDRLPRQSMLGNSYKKREQKNEYHYQPKPPGKEYEDVRKNIDKNTLTWSTLSSEYVPALIKILDLVYVDEVRYVYGLFWDPREQLTEKFVMVPHFLDFYGGELEKYQVSGESEKKITLTIGQLE